MEVIRIKKECIESSYCKELLMQYIKGKKVIIVLENENISKQTSLFENEYALLVGYKMGEKSLALTDYFRTSGISVRNLTLNEMGIMTNNSFLDAIVENIDPYYYKKYLCYYDCLIVSGGLGKCNNQTTLLGDLGDQLTAISLGIRLDCQITFFDQDFKELTPVSDFDELYDCVIKGKLDFSMKALMLAKNNKPLLYLKRGG